MIGRAEGIDALLGARGFLVPAGTAKSRVILARVKRLPQSFGLHDVGVDRGTVRERRDILGLAARVGVHHEVKVVFRRHLVAEGDHFLELPAGIDMQKRERDAAGEEGLAGKVQQNGGILAHRIEHDRLFKLGGHLAENMDRFAFKGLQMRIERRLGRLRMMDFRVGKAGLHRSSPEIAGGRLS